MLAPLNDSTTYKVLADDPNSPQIKSNSWIKKMHDRKYINTYYEPVAPRIYGLSKAHKNDLPLRLVVSFIRFPTYSLSKFLSDMKTCSDF